MCKFVAVNRVGKPCALVAHARFEMGAVDLEFLRSAAYLITDTKKGRMFSVLDLRDRLTLPQLQTRW